mgnify:FL=1|jgi:hypothetical protein
MLEGFHEDTGQVFRTDAKRQEWIGLLNEIDRTIRECGLQEEILFHGTTIGKARSILKSGMRPTDAFELFDGEEMTSEGSFWGTIRTAAWYAEDSSIHRKGGRPAIIACPVSFLQTYTTLAADIPSRDFPVPGLTRLEDPAVAARWPNGQYRTWQESLEDLGSVTALHDYELSLDAAVIADDIESFQRILHSCAFSA